MEKEFVILNQNDLINVIGGDALSGAISIVGGTAVSLASCVAVITATTMTVPAALLCGGVYCLGKIAVAAGIIDIANGE